MVDTILIPWGALFQEFHTPAHVNYFDKLQMSALVRNIWITCSFLLVISFAGNLKAAFVTKTFEDSPKSVQELAERYGKHTWAMGGWGDAPSPSVQKTYPLP